MAASPSSGLSRFPAFDVERHRLVLASVAAALQLRVLPAFDGAGVPGTELDSGETCVAQHTAKVNPIPHPPMRLATCARIAEQQFFAPQANAHPSPCPGGRVPDTLFEHGGDRGVVSTRGLARHVVRGQRMRVLLPQLFETRKKHPFYPPRLRNPKDSFLK